MLQSSYEFMITLPEYYEVEKEILNNSLSMLHKIIAYEKMYGIIILKTTDDRKEAVLSEYFGKHMFLLWKKWTYVVKMTHEKQIFFEYTFQPREYKINKYIKN